MLSSLSRRCNVMRAFKELKPGRDGVQLQPSLPLCPNHELKFCDGMVKVEGTGEPVFFEAAEEVEEHKVGGRDSIRMSDSHVVSILGACGLVFARNFIVSECIWGRLLIVFESYLNSMGDPGERCSEVEVSSSNRPGPCRRMALQEAAGSWSA